VCNKKSIMPQFSKSYAFTNQSYVANIGMFYMISINRHAV